MTLAIDPRYVYTVVALAELSILIFLVRRLMRLELRGLKGYGRLIYLVTSAITIGIVAWIAYFWGLFQLLFGSIAAAGALGLVFLFGLLPIMTDIMNGVLIHLDKDINVGVDVEIDGKRGVIEEISLTRTKIASRDGLVIFPNRRFRETAVIVRGAPADSLA
jgi:small-conductance mechanosensitive channel